jgi:predicted site-specific integrase-resolvase
VSAMPRKNATPLSASEVSRLTGYDISTVCRWARAGDIKADKLPGLRGAWLIPESQLGAIRPKNGTPKPQA